jgi:RND family efflux transporter MFP subunit
LFWPGSGIFISTLSLVLILLPMAGRAAGGDAQAAMRPPELAKRNSLSDPAPGAGTPTLPTAKPELDCLIEPNMSVELATSVSGIVKVVNVDRGDLIRTGQVLAQLEAEVEKANVARERARAEFAAKKYHRMRELYKEQMVSAQQMEEAKADSELAAAELQKAIEMLNQRTVYAPFNGVVVDRFVSPGELVESKKVLKVAQINPLSVEVIAPISMLGEFQFGGKVRVVPEGPITGPYEAKVKLVDRVVDAASGSFRVRLALPNPKYQISAGVRCRAQLLAPNVEVAKPKNPRRPAPKAVSTKAVTPKSEAQKPGVAPAGSATAASENPTTPNEGAPAVSAKSATSADSAKPTEAGAATGEAKDGAPRVGASESVTPERKPGDPQTAGAVQASADVATAAAPPATAQRPGPASQGSQKTETVAPAETPVQAPGEAAPQPTNSQ